MKLNATDRQNELRVSKLLEIYRKSKMSHESLTWDVSTKNKILKKKLK